MVRRMGWMVGIDCVGEGGDCGDERGKDCSMKRKEGIRIVKGKKGWRIEGIEGGREVEGGGGGREGLNTRI